MESEEELEELRRLLLEPDRVRLRRLETTMDLYPRPETVARALPDAVAMASPAFSEALGGPVSQALKVTVRKDPQPLIDVIFPLLGPAIRKSIQAALQGMVASLNATTEHSLNLGLRYRAWRARMPFGEFLLLHTLIYRVELAYLVHNNTGLVLLSCQDPSSHAADPDMVAGMLTAMQDFGRDSLQAGADEGLEQLRLGEHLLMVEAGPSASLALALRGTPPPQLRQQMQETLEAVHFRHAADLEEFAGDPAPFQKSEADLERLIQFERKLPSGAPSREVRMLAMVFLGFVALLLGWWGYRAYVWSQYLSLLENQPGLWVGRTSAQWWGWGKHHIFGLRDPLAVDPDSLKPKWATFPIEGHWEPYQSLDGPILQRRIRSLMAPPASVQLSFEKGVLSASGQASQEWMWRAKVVASALPGVERYLDNHLEDIDPLGRLRKRLAPPSSVEMLLQGNELILSGSAPHSWLVSVSQRLDKDFRLDQSGVIDLEQQRLAKFKGLLEGLSLYFEPGKTQFKGPSEEVLDTACAHWKHVEELAGMLELKLQLQVTGQSDATGTPAQNARLSKERAALVRSLLVKKGIAESAMSIEAVQATVNDPRLRRVIFLVVEK